MGHAENRGQHDSDGFEYIAHENHYGYEDDAGQYDCEGRPGENRMQTLI